MRQRDTGKILVELGNNLTSDKIAILTHNNPDPDAIAGAFGLRLLLKKHFQRDSSIFYGGLIGRAENRCLVSQLGIPLIEIKNLDYKKFRVIAVVDTQPGAGNVSLPPSIIPDIVIDHHVPLRKKTYSAPFHDVRPDYGSSSTIVTEYLRDAGVAIPVSVATALFYGIKTDTFDLFREAGPYDKDAYKFLFDKVDRKTINHIEHPRHPKKYFSMLAEALQRAEIHDDVCITELWNIPYPDIIAEVADWFYSLQRIKWILSIGVTIDGLIYLSVRSREMKRNAGRLVRNVVGKHGMAGGHGLIAGGEIILDNPTREDLINEVHNLKRRFLKALKKPDEGHFSRLIHDKNELLDV